jgi:hypothetical protein
MASFKSTAFYSGAFFTDSGGPAAQTLTPTLFSNSNSVFAPTVTTGAVTLVPTLLSNSNTLFAPASTVGAVTLTATLFSNTNTIFAPVVSQAGGGVQSLTATLLTNTNDFFVLTVTAGAVDLTASLLTNNNALYTPVISQGAFTQTLVQTEILKYYTYDEVVAMLDPQTFADAVWAKILNGPYTASDLVNVIAAATGGKASGAESSSIVFRDLADTTNTIEATVDSFGNRSSVTYGL